MSAYRPEQTEEHLRGELESLRREFELVRRENLALIAEKKTALPWGRVVIAMVAISSAWTGAIALLWFVRFIGGLSVDGGTMSFLTIPALYSVGFVMIKAIRKSE